ncbi:hypothetical protein HDU99_001125 [Rhizoclosmatium hyalinum]|nr:hypothetical protein HDU99_001125 [Rhizoclosmatium hyalinum]
MSSSTEEDEFSNIHASELQRLVDDNDHLEKEVERLTSEVSRLNSARSQLSRSQTDLVAKISSFNQKFKDAEASAQTLQQKLESARANVESLNQELVVSHNDNDRMTEEVNQLTVKLNDSETARTAIELEVDDNKKQIDELTKRTEELKHELDDSRKKIKTLKQDCNARTEDNKRLNAEVVRLNTENTKLSTSNAEDKAELQKLTKRLEEAVNARQKKEDEVNSLTREIEKVRGEKKELERRNEEKMKNRAEINCSVLEAMEKLRSAISLCSSNDGGMVSGKRNIQTPPHSNSRTITPVTTIEIVTDDIDQCRPGGKCLVCGNVGNLVECEGTNCKLDVHIDCYKPNFVLPDGSWYCDRCAVGKNLDEVDMVCCSAGNDYAIRLAATSDNADDTQFVHANCAKWNSKTEFQKGSEAIDVSLALLETSGTCSHCNLGSGMLVYCNKVKRLGCREHRNPGKRVGGGGNQIPHNKRSKTAITSESSNSSST